MKTIGDLVTYIMNNRRKNGFKDWTKIGLINALDRAATEGTMFYSVDDKGDINGIVFGTKDNKAKIMFVQEILTTDKKVLNKFIISFKKLFPGFHIRADRKGRKIEYNTAHLIQKLS